MEVYAELDKVDCMVKNIMLNFIRDKQKTEQDQKLNIIDQIIQKIDEINITINEIKTLCLILGKEM